MYEQCSVLDDLLKLIIVRKMWMHSKWILFNLHFRSFSYFLTQNILIMYCTTDCVNETVKFPCSYQRRLFSRWRQLTHLQLKTTLNKNKTKAAYTYIMCKNMKDFLHLNDLHSHATMNRMVTNSGSTTFASIKIPILIFQCNV